MANPSGDVPFAIDGKTISSVERASSSVGGIGLEWILLIAFLAMVLVGVLGILTYLYSARDVLETEIAEVEAEKRAFLAFADRIESLSTERTATAMATPQSVQTFEPNGPPVRDVARAFEETVMAVPHYEETYGDDVVAEMEAELDGTLVSSLHRQGELSPAMKQGLRQQAMEAADKRRNLLSSLSEEREVLEASESTLADAVANVQRMNERTLGDRPYEDLIENHERLEQLRGDIGELIETRQKMIHSTRRTLQWQNEGVTLQEYLYTDLGTTYPVLQAATRLDRLISRAQSRVRRALWSRA